VFLGWAERSHQEFEGSESVEVEGLQREFAFASARNIHRCTRMVTRTNPLTRFCKAEKESDEHDRKRARRASRGIKALPQPCAIIEA
jgi:hypothetical protein